MSARMMRTYAARLRAVGSYLDQQRMRGILILESGTEFVIRAQTEGRMIRASTRPLASALLSPEDLVAIDDEERLLRTREVAADRRRNVVGNRFFPQGYAGPLRALGVEMDALGGVSLITIRETATRLYLDYYRASDDLPTGGAFKHLTLSVTDLEAMCAAAEARRRTFPLAARIQRK